MEMAKTGCRVILGTGGTIAGRASDPMDNVGYVAGQVGVADLVGAVPALRGMPLEFEQIGQIDSKDMGLDLWKPLLEALRRHLARDDVAGVVITHGTDTLEETAFLLQEVLQPTKPVVLTCAMRPATALVPDGPQNLLDAVMVAGNSEVRGVVVVCAGQMHRARDVAKVHSYRVDAFDSGDAGPLACVEEGQLRWFHAPEALSMNSSKAAPALLDRLLRAQRLPRVDIVTSHAGADGEMVRAMLAAGRLEPRYMPQGLVVAATGNGTVHRDLLEALSEAVAAGVVVVRSTRCARGRVIPDAANALPDSGGLSPVKARLALALRLLTD